MYEVFTDGQLSEQINKNSEAVKELLKDEDRFERFLERLEFKLEKFPVIGRKLSNIPMVVSLVGAYVRKDYQDIPIGSIIAIVSALIYFVSPIDLLPDSIPILGFVDDAAMFAFVWRMVENDVEDYKKWQKQNGKRIIKD